jgi:acyl-coenzyme A synthetase/AMP-(fatty) acid ligase
LFLLNLETVMSVVPQAATSSYLPLMAAVDAPHPLVWSKQGVLSTPQFIAAAKALGARLPKTQPGHTPPAMINLCDNRQHFLLAYAAALISGHTTLMPASRADDVVSELERSYAGSYRCDDALVATVPLDALDAEVPLLSSELLAMIGFTSGSTGRSQAHRKLWRSISASTMLNATSIRAACGLVGEGSTPSIVATVPPQHMYGMELSVLLPLLGAMSVHSSRPLFPADIAAALADMPEPRILVSTPVHLRALLDSGQTLPRIHGVISATAPLDAQLATAIETKFDTVMFEMFGSTETCIFATRRTAHETEWQLYEGVQLTPRPDGTMVSAPWFVEPMLLQDIVELLPAGRFRIVGRNTDMIEVAGKRASLTDLTRRFRDIPGVRDAVVFPPESSVGGVQRVAAIVVAPGMSEREIIAQLARGVDAAFLPRPLVLVDQLPRNETGKLPRERLLAVLRENKSKT